MCYCCRSQGAFVCISVICSQGHANVRAELVVWLHYIRRLHKRKHPSSFTPALEEDLAESTDLGDKLLDDQLLDDAQDAALVR